MTPDTYRDAGRLASRLCASGRAWYGYSHEDLRGELAVLAERHMVRYAPGRGASLATWRWRALHKSMATIQRTARRVSRGYGAEHVTLDPRLPAATSAPELRLDVRRALGRVSPQDRAYARLLAQGYTPQEAREALLWPRSASWSTTRRLRRVFAGLRGYVAVRT